MKDFKFIPYSKNLVSRARELRKEETSAERFFWNEVLKDKKLLGLKFTRQKPIDNFIVDFYCASLGVVIEIDGKIHFAQKSRDRERDEILKQKFGIKVVRYKNEDVLNNLEKVIEDLVKRLKR